MPDQPSLGALAELPSRLVYSVLKPAVRLAARFNLTMSRVTELVQLAYFEELRRTHPQHLKDVARSLGVSLRTAASLSQRFKADFFRPETDVEPQRRITELLLGRSLQAEEIRAELADLSAEDVQRALDALVARNWVARDADGTHSVDVRLRSFVDADMSRRVDALNNQMAVLTDAVWARFVRGDEHAVARTWVFAADPAAVLELMQFTIQQLRHGVVDLEEAASAQDVHRMHGITIALAPVEPEETP